MFRNLAIALAFIAAAVGAIVYFAYRDQGGAPAETASPAERHPLPGRDGGVSVQAARAMLEQIARQSGALMPEGYAGVYLTMPLAELRRVRPRIQRNPSQRADAELWEEDDPSGARVIYLVSPGMRLLEQAQFASRVDDAQQLPTHFRALEAHYGGPTGVWDCPQTEEASPVRRFTWRHEGASLMEAVLIVGQQAAITLVVAGNDDVAHALIRSHCQPVRRAEDIARFPVAGEIRGERQDFVREVIRDR